MEKQGSSMVVHYSGSMGINGSYIDVYEGLSFFLTLEFSEI